LFGSIIAISKFALPEESSHRGGYLSRISCFTFPDDKHRPLSRSVAQHAASFSTKAECTNPACSRPRACPPAPAHISSEESMPTIPYRSSFVLTRKFDRCIVQFSRIPLEKSACALGLLSASLHYRLRKRLTALTGAGLTRWKASGSMKSVRAVRPGPKAEPVWCLLSWPQSY
jgi:hypothetical protein